MMTRKPNRPTHRISVLKSPTAALRLDPALIAMFGLLGLLASSRNVEQLQSH